MIGRKWGPWPAIVISTSLTCLAMLVIEPHLRGMVPASQVQPLPESTDWLTASVLNDSSVQWLARFSTYTWLIIAGFAVYHLSFSVLGTLFSLRDNVESKAKTQLRPLRFCIFYATCDDFVLACAQSCTQLKYAADHFHVVICDDSTSPEARDLIDRFVAEHANVSLSRRSDRAGFKAGNLNQAFDKHCQSLEWDWVVIVDADELLPEDYLSKLASEIIDLPQRVAYVQCRRLPRNEHLGALDAHATHFQTVLHKEIRLFGDRSMPWREQLGFYSFLGHGGAIRASAWSSLGGFPVRVSEDLALSMQIMSAAGQGKYIDSVVAYEDYPTDFAAFSVRIRKFSAGAAELLRRDLFSFVVSRATLTDKVDAAIWLSAYVAPLLLTINLPVSAWLARRATLEYSGVLSLHLPYLFLTMAAYSIAIPVSVMSLGDALRYWFWAFSIYAASLPGMALAFLKGLLGAAQFSRTPKSPRLIPSLSVSDLVAMIIGAVAAAWATSYWSVFSPIIVSFALAYGLSPVWYWLHRSDWRGRLAHGLIYIPGACYLWGITSMWLSSGP